MIFFKKQTSLYLIPISLFLFSITTSIGAQKSIFNVADSLKHKTPYELVDLIKSSDTEKSEVYEEILLNLHKNDTSIAKLYYKLGWFFYGEENFKKSIEYANRIYKIADELKDENFLFRSHILKGATYLREGKHQNSFDYYVKALHLAEKEKNLKKEIIANSGIVLVSQKMNRLDKALKISKEMLKSINKTSYKNGKNHVRILTNINEIYLDKGQYDSVMYYAGKGIKLSKSLDYKEGLVDLYIKMGIVFYYKKEYDLAFNYLGKAKSILENHNIDSKLFPTVKINYFMASCYYEQQLYDNAIFYLCQTMDFIEVNDLSKLPVIQSHLLLANCYFKKKDFEQAHYWENVYVKLNSNYQEDKDKTVDKIYERETDKYEQEIENLKNEQGITKYILMISIVISLVFIFIAFRHYKKQRSNKEVFDELIERISRLESEKNKKEKKKNSTKIIIDDNKVNEVLKGLSRLERQEYFLKSECNLRTTAKKVKTNSTYLTKIIHIHKGKNFNDYLTDLRIEYALQRLKNDKKFRAFSVKSIAVEVGYKSDDAFAKRFKAKTGLNPSYYIKNIEKLKQEES
ncbi:helix-turn-helix domain-containing protein [Aquimarina sp. 2201CG5-10]|uniref:helix-turn-helix domain-containing protein n=1 Tax=Aquimarina callyspongiae TaxID=3098150 RepID=UPI002AB33DCB|nr:helix-turn-helix domain-containing protein [Aquimarina sp. 2201CG5-10]MDY8137091.1 helix-turn-helix domain-containing protein [Aquimarina sp. 2201CG5-10]